jgi:hypothetical protein
MYNPSAGIYTTSALMMSLHHLLLYNTYLEIRQGCSELTKLPQGCRMCLL